MSGFNLLQYPPTLTPKNSYDIADWLLDFSPYLPAGQTIQSIGTITITPNDTMTQLAETITSGSGGVSTAVGVKLSGGTSLQQYTISAYVLTSVSPDQFEGSIIIPIR